jgi:hypothetical protein
MSNDPFRVIDLDKPTGCYEVSVWHHDDGQYEVIEDRGLGQLGVYETGNRDKALGVAEYLESTGRYRATDDGVGAENAGTPFTGGIVHWDCARCAAASSRARR